MSGDTTVIQPPTYGTQNVFDPDNTPGGRMNYTGWQDSNGFFWLFGGQNDMSGNDYADLWKFDPASYEWTWVSGSSQANNIGSSGNNCDTAASFHPKSRWENRARWIDACNNLWLFGGSHGSFTVNDLWIYNAQLNVWSLVSGSTSYNQLGVYGTKGVPDPANVPGARMGAVSSIDNSGNLWLFGGSKDNSIGVFFNDLWRYVPDPNCPASIVCAQSIPPNFAANDTTVCEKFCIDFYDSSLNNPVSWLWNFPGGNPSSSTDQNPTNICYDDPGVYDVTLKTTNASGATDSTTFVNYITVFSNPFAPVITQSGNVLTSSNGLTYQWQLNSEDIPGATDQSYEITESGLYTVIITNENGCQAQSSVDATFIGIEEVNGNFTMNIYPNPSNGNFIVEVSGESGAENISIEITNSLSQVIFFSEEKISSIDWKKKIDLSSIAPGVYTIQLTSNNADACPDFLGARKKIIITK
jgi:PKD repeat protein